jgi:glycosyltransferase involved in cell wall biosynthesis
MVFVGDGKRRGELEALARQLRADGVAFHAPRALDGLADSLAAADVHLVSQSRNTQGIIVPSKLYGVLAAARPVLYIGPSDTEVAAVVRASGAGLVVGPGRVDAAADAMRTLALAPERATAMGLAGRRYYEQHFGRSLATAAITSIVENAARVPQA